jgi:amino acid permease
MSDSEKEEKKNEKPFPKDSQIQGEEEDDAKNNENENNNNDDNNFPEGENSFDSGKRQSNINNNSNDENDFNNENNGQENKNEENLRDNSSPEKENNNNDSMEHENEEIKKSNMKKSMNNKSKEEKLDDFNDDNNFKDENGENNKDKDNSFRFSNEASHGALNVNMKDNEFEYEEDNKKENEDENNIENNNNSFGFRDSDVKNDDNNNINNNQYENNENNNNKNNKNMFKDNLRNSENSDNANINNNNDDDNKFSNLNPYNTDNNKKNNNINNNSNFIKNPYTSNNSKFNNNFNNNNNNNKFNNNNNNNFNDNNNNSINNNRNPNGGFGYTPSPNKNFNYNTNTNQTAAQFIPQEPPITNKLNNYNYSSSKPYSDNVFHNSDYDPFYERFEEYPEDSDGFDIDPSKKGTDSSRTAGIQIANTIMGAGILSIPLMMSYLGILIGTILLIFLAVTTIYTVYILMRCHQITGKSGYSMFGKITMGTVGSIIVKIIIIVNNMGICICYLRIFGESFQTIFQSFVSKNSYFMTNWHNYLFILFGAIIIFFFIFIKNISKLKKVSYIGVIAVLVFAVLLIVLLLYKTIASELDSDVSWRFLFPECTFPQAFHAAPTVFLAFLFQFNVFPIYYSLKHRSMSSMLKSTKLGVILSLIIFLAVGIIGFLLYGFFDNYDDENYQEIYGEPNNDTATYDTILDKLNDDMILYKGYNAFVVIIIIIICVAFLITCIASFPILFLSLRVNFVHALEVCRRAKDNDNQIVKITQGSYSKKTVSISKKALIIITICLYLFMVGIAILIYNLKTMFHVIGTIAGTTIAFILPNIFYIRIVRMSGKNYSITFPIIMIAIGVLFFLLSFIMAFFDE